jgi:hypothetical protein
MLGRVLDEGSARRFNGGSPRRFFYEASTMVLDGGVSTAFLPNCSNPKDEEDQTLDIARLEA